MEWLLLLILIPCIGILFLYQYLKNNSMKIWKKELVWFPICGFFSALVFVLYPTLEDKEDIDWMLFSFLFPFLSLFYKMTDGVMNNGMFRRKETPLEDAKELISRRIEFLHKLDMQYCDVRWSDTASELEKKIARDYSNHTAFAKSQMQELLKQIENL